MSARALILGASGQVGRALRMFMPDALAVGKELVDLESMAFLDVLDFLHQEHRFEVIYNAAAFTRVDDAEGEREMAQSLWINGIAVGALGDWCALRGVRLVHFSTDYVFDGTSDTPYAEDTPTSPINSYGWSKAEGERLLSETQADYLVLRTSWLYGVTGKNFYRSMLTLMQEKESLQVVSDQWGSPTYAPHFARAAIAAFTAASQQSIFPTGIYHLCHAGYTTRFEFARAILKLATGHDHALRCQRIDPIPSSDFPAAAQRPLKARLDCTKAKRVLGVELPRWEDGLTEAIEASYGKR